MLNKIKRIQSSFSPSSIASLSFFQKFQKINKQILFSFLFLHIQSQLLSTSSSIISASSQAFSNPKKNKNWSSLRHGQTHSMRPNLRATAFAQLLQLLGRLTPFLSPLFPPASMALQLLLLCYCSFKFCDLLEPIPSPDYDDYEEDEVLSSELAFDETRKVKENRY